MPSAVRTCVQAPEWSSGGLEKADQKELSELRWREVGRKAVGVEMGHGTCSGQREKSVQRNDSGGKQRVWGI